MLARDSFAKQAIAGSFSRTGKLPVLPAGNGRGKNEKPRRDAGVFVR